MLKIKASEAQIKFPTEHDWDKFFRDAKNMNGMKAGERPDTVILRVSLESCKTSCAGVWEKKGVQSLRNEVT